MAGERGQLILRDLGAWWEPKRVENPNPLGSSQLIERKTQQFPIV